MRIEEDPNRTARIALLKHKETNRLTYIISPKGIKPGDILYSGEKVLPEPGNCLPIRAIPPGTLIHNIGINPGEGGKIARSAGM
jgi:large subunit ribosomal protein L2